MEVKSICPICNSEKSFSAPDEYKKYRAHFRATDCEYRLCIPRTRAVASVLFSFFPRESVTELSIHESSPTPMGLSLWLRQNCQNYVMSGFFPGETMGEIVRGFRNENLEEQTFSDNTFDLVLHLDVLEHLFDPFAALREIFRTLKPGGMCLFTAPTYPGRTESEQVAFNEGGKVRIVGEPEHHGNPHSNDGALVTWRYGYDLPLLIGSKTEFDVEVRRWHAKEHAIMGRMTEVYILKKPTTPQTSE